MSPRLRERKISKSLIYYYQNVIERETRLELATPTLARSCSTN